LRKNKQNPSPEQPKINTCPGSSHVAPSQFLTGHLWLGPNAVSKGYAVIASVPLPATHGGQFSFIIVDEFYLCLERGREGLWGPKGLR